MKNFYLSWKKFWILGWLGVASFTASLPGAGFPPMGPLVDEFSVSLEPQTSRTEWFGPFYSHETSPYHDQRAMPPLWSRLSIPEQQFTGWDFLYPIFTSDRYGEESRWQFLQLLSYSHGQQDEVRTRRYSLFPFLFWQRSEQPEQRYAAFFPLYGRLKNRFLRDDIRFALFPLYARTEKRKIRTTNFLYPIFHRRTDEQGTPFGWQAWPLWSYERRTLRPNPEEDLLTESLNKAPIRNYRKLSLFWPIFFDERYNTQEPNPRHRQAVLPLYSFDYSPDLRSTTLLWPFFSHSNNLKRKYSEWHTPWPFIGWARGEGKTMNRVWPLFHLSKTPVEVRASFLWPILQYRRNIYEDGFKERTRWLQFLHTDIRQYNRTTGESSHTSKFWPLWDYERLSDQRSRLQILAPIESLLIHNRSVQRNLSPLWSLWRSESNPREGLKSHSLLWNLYRQDQTPERSESALLFGLIQWQTSTKGTEWKWLHCLSSSTWNEPDHP